MAAVSVRSCASLVRLLFAGSRRRQAHVSGSVTEDFMAFRRACVKKKTPPSQVREFVEAGRNLHLPLTDRVALDALSLTPVANCMHRLVWLLSYRTWKSATGDAGLNADGHGVLQELAIHEFDLLLEALDRLDTSLPLSAKQDEGGEAIQTRRLAVLSFFRNVVASAFAYSLLSSADVAGIVSSLQKFGWRGSVIDPMAGAGFHSLLFANAGVCSIAYDGGATPEASTWFPVHGGIDAADAVCKGNDDAHSGALFLSWPPSTDDAAARALEAFRGNYVVFLGDDGTWSGCPLLRRSLFHSSHWESLCDRAARSWPGCGVKDRLILLRRSS